jgi:endogenous inhibitor of DNA gyrase (YacG/DUF329 family)
MAQVLHCPICGKDVSFDNPEMPFCSDRCRTVDLGNWATEKYVISTPRQNELEESDFLPDHQEGTER